MKRGRVVRTPGPKPDTDKVQVELPTAVLKRARAQAADEGLTFKRWVELAITAKLGESREAGTGDNVSTVHASLMCLDPGAVVVCRKTRAQYSLVEYVTDTPDGMPLVRLRSLGDFNKDKSLSLGTFLANYRPRKM